MFILAVWGSRRRGLSHARPRLTRPGVNQRHEIEGGFNASLHHPVRRPKPKLKLKNMHGHKIDVDPQNPPLVSDVRDVRAGCGCDVFNVTIKNTQKAHTHHNFKGFRS
ncbi:uncharacterized protein B0T23DRAFT_416113 [Neurospora hispaniola]|uniref:Uncharacterized protein n=1 Tax=Neurospora hispaniola TaxID=588809 RepID=A0AAJ0MLZ8_9PEZI|nr:hypothetical protein B0T23DRAFT_416113 [Neurospora hispaniola]